VSVTCLPHHGPARTVEASVELAQAGYQVIPHLAARSIASRDELRRYLDLLEGAGVRELFLVAGDNREPAGPYRWSGQLLEEVAEFSPTFSAGIAGYPEGHPDLTTLQLLEAMQLKAGRAASVVTQMCFSAQTVSDYVASLRRQGITLPVWIGVPGPIASAKLLAMGARLGVGRSLKLARRTGLARALRPGASFNSPALIRNILAAVAGDPGIAGVHIYTFNDLGRLPALLRAVTSEASKPAMLPGQGALLADKI
jgi:methylenetetrahydrofolate reductase (NADPH)